MVPCMRGCRCSDNGYPQVPSPAVCKPAISCCLQLCSLCCLFCPTAMHRLQVGLHLASQASPVPSCSRPLPARHVDHHHHRMGQTGVHQSCSSTVATAAAVSGFKESLQSTYSPGSTVHPDTDPNISSTRLQQQPFWLQLLRSDEVWYLAYGSNMNPKVLTGRRRVRPQQSLPCYVPGFTLSFGVQGFPWAEPGFATIQPCSGSPSSSNSSWRRHVCADSTPCLHGVLHRVTKQEWAVIKASEGVLGSSNSSVGYQVVEVDCVLYDGKTVIRAVSLQAAAASLHHTGRDVQPSARYLGLLQAGSRHHGLDSHYQHWLDSLQSYKRPSALSATIGSLASGAVLLSAAYTAVPAYMLSRATGSSGSSSREAGGERQEMQQPAVAAATVSGGQSTVVDAGAAGGSVAGSNADPTPPSDFVSYLRWYTGSSQKLVWDVHDSLAPWLGSGSSVSKHQYCSIFYTRTRRWPTHMHAHNRCCSICM